ncbi:MAG: DUF2892 domain-containing protein [Carboxydocellales bacterium]
MYVENGKGSLIRLMGGLLILISVVLGFTVSEYFFYFTGWVGLMLVLSATTGFCPMELILKAIGVEQRKICKM